jgi:hypothetical protein
MYTQAVTWLLNCVAAEITLFVAFSISQNYCCTIFGDIPRPSAFVLFPFLIVSSINYGGDGQVWVDDRDGNFSCQHPTVQRDPEARSASYERFFSESFFYNPSCVMVTTNNPSCGSNAFSVLHLGIWSLFLSSHVLFDLSQHFLPSGPSVDILS